MDSLLDYEGFANNIDNVFLPVHRNEDENSLLFAIGYATETAKEEKELKSLDLLDFSHLFTESEGKPSSLSSSVCSSKSTSLSLSTDEDADTLFDESPMNGSMNTLSVLDLPCLEDEGSRDALYCREVIPEDDDITCLPTPPSRPRQASVYVAAPTSHRVTPRPAIIPKRRSKAVAPDSGVITNSKDVTTHHSYAKYPYPCHVSGCPQTFPSVYDQKRHISQTHPKLRCPHPKCKHEFLDTRQLQMHVCKHRSVYVCDNCDVTFYSKITLQTHFTMNNASGGSCVPCYALSLSELRRRVLARSNGRFHTVPTASCAQMEDNPYRRLLMCPPERKVRNHSVNHNAA